MSSKIVPSIGSTEIIEIFPNQKIGIYTKDNAQLYQILEYANYPSTEVLIGEVNNEMKLFGPFGSNTIKVYISNGDLETYYDIGTAPFIIEESNYIQFLSSDYSGTTLPVSAWINGIIVSEANDPIGLPLELPVATALESASFFQINDSFDWTVINTGTERIEITNAPSSGHTYIGNIFVEAGTSVKFKTRKSALNTFITYRIAG